MRPNGDFLKEKLEQGTDVAIHTTPYSVNQLRQLAKAALKGNSKLWLAPGPELDITDVNNITGEAPRHVVLDFQK